MDATMLRIKTKFMVFFERIPGADHEYAMNKLLESIDCWAFSKDIDIVGWKWRHMTEGSRDNPTIYVEAEIIYRETIESFNIAGRADENQTHASD